MTEQTNAAATESKDAKAKTVAADMPQRSVFATPADAEQYLAASAERYADFGEIAEKAFVAPRLLTDDEGAMSFDAEAYGAFGFATMISLLRKKGTGGQVKAIIAAPIPTLELLLASPEQVEAGELPELPKTAGVEFVRAIILKELNHRAVRDVREAEDVQSVADKIPTTVEGYISSSRGDGGIMEAFDELYKDINATLSAAVPQWARRRFTKPELRKSLESRGYALEVYPEIEEAGVNGSLFEKALLLGINGANRKGLDPAIFVRWQESRNAKTYDAGEDEEAELDLSALTEAMLADPKATDSKEGEGTTKAEAEAAPTA